MAKKDQRKEGFIEITPRMRSFAFLNLQAAVSHIHNLFLSVRLHNQFPHVVGVEQFFEFAAQKHAEKYALDDNAEDLKNYILRADLGRNMWFFNELAFVYLVNAFVVYCADILAVAALGSPEKFDLSIRLRSAGMDSRKSAIQLRQEMEVALVSKVVFMTYPELKKILLAKIRLAGQTKKLFHVVDKAVSKRHKMVHGLGIANWAIFLHQTGDLGKREKVTDAQMSSLWKSVAKLARAIDIAVMREFDVWRGADICAPGLYRRKGGQLIRAHEERARKD